MSPPHWISRRIGSNTFQLLNLDHPEVEAAILSEMESGVDVYYDRRWEVTGALCQFLSSRPHWVQDRSVLVIGAGIGMETLVIGHLCHKMYVNDIAPVALELCARQLKRNRIHNFGLLQGPYERLAFPPVDIVVGCFLVYNPETRRAMKRFLDGCT